MTRFRAGSVAFRLVLLVAAFCWMAAAAVPAQRNDRPPSRRAGRFTIQNAASDKFMDIDRNDGSTVRQFDASNQRSQMWDIEEAGNGYVRIRSAENGKFLDIMGGIPRDEAHLMVNPPNGGDSQLWIIEDAGEGLVRITSRFGKCIDDPDASRDSGIRWQLWRPIEKFAEKFRMLPVEGAPGREMGDRDRDRGGELEHDHDHGGRGKQSAYHQGYILGVEDAQARIERSYSRHRDQYDSERQEAFMQGYNDGYDSGRMDTSRMEARERDIYDQGFRRGRRDYEDRNNPDYMRYADQFDERSERFFRRGYEAGYNSFR
jgi:Ricin-type beta-trefoil lectin domain-like